MKDPDSSSFAVRESSDKCAPVVPHCCHPIPVETGRESSKKSERPPKRHSNERNSGRPRNGFSRHRPARRAVLMRDGGRWGPDGSNVTPTEGPPSSQDRTVTRPSPSATASGAPSSSSQTPRRTNSETASLADSTSAGSEARQDQLAPDDLSCELCFAWMTGHIRKRKEGHPACPQCAAKYLHSPQCGHWLPTPVRSLETPCNVRSCGVCPAAKGPGGALPSLLISQTSPITNRRVLPDRLSRALLVVKSLLQVLERDSLQMKTGTLRVLELLSLSGKPGGAKMSPRNLIHFGCKQPWSNCVRQGGLRRVLWRPSELNSVRGPCR
mmetsp:Transcript_1868/g.3892  ORF Transcript_1868/g.3892 Transcript_1868/m.3892 type:complete len:325 (+) Transcript_1868:214-1188(+)